MITAALFVAFWVVLVAGLVALALAWTYPELALATLVLVLCSKVVKAWPGRKSSSR